MYADELADVREPERMVQHPYHRSPALYEERMRPVDEFPLRALSFLQCFDTVDWVSLAGSESDR